VPFKVHIFQNEVDDWLEGAARIDLALACQAYTALTTPQQRAKSIQRMMDVLDQEVDERVRWEV
jgi:hypothetical protein